MFIGLLIFLAATSTTTGTVPLTTPTSADTTPPSAPILISPPNNSTTTQAIPEFAWYQSTDPNGNNVIYNLYFFNTLTYSNISSLGNSSSPSYSTRLEDDTIRLTPTFGLASGRYSWYVTASDLSGNTSRSDTWNFTLDTSSPSLPATIAKVETRLSFPIILSILLALLLITLLIFLWYKKRYNLILLDSNLRPLHHATIYHSNPTLSSSSFIIHTSSYKLYVPHLTRYSTLTIRLQDKEICTTYILSISAKQRVYTIILE